MAKVIKNSIYTGLSGKVGNCVYITTRRGTFVRAWVKPANPRTPKQVAHRKVFGEAGKRMWALTPEEIKTYKERARLSGTRDWYRFAFRDILAGLKSSSENH